MSYTELHVGKIQLLFKTNDYSREKDCEILCKKNNILYMDDYDTWEETLRSELYNKYIIVNDYIFEVFDHHEEEASDYVSHMTRTKNEEYSFVFMFYNGGTCFSEMLEDELEKQLKIK